MKKKIVIAISWIIVIVWLGVIFHLSAQPATKSDELSKTVSEVVVNSVQKVSAVYEVDYRLDVDSLNHYVRKFSHFFEYLVLGMLVVNALIQSFLKSAKVGTLIKYIMVALLFCVLYSVSDELHQSFVSGRGPAVRDVLIDSLGAVMGVVLYGVGYRIHLQLMYFM